MSIWGKIIGGATGFAFGGPLGAFLGGVAGHAIDKIKTGQKLPEETALKQIGFTIGVIVLSAKMAKADGKVTVEEIKAFKEKINVQENEIKNIAKLLFKYINLARVERCESGLISTLGKRV